MLLEDWLQGWHFSKEGVTSGWQIHEFLKSSHSLFQQLEDV